MKKYEVYMWDWRYCLIAEAIFAKKSDAVKFGAKQLRDGNCYACSLTYHDDKVTKQLGDITKNERVA